ncbi:DUF2971 domain-containing protein [Pseudodesulfovibrio nedwellii]|uniref:DUF2971 domain-containing protein n=1 Tax=Pseudodesulfovibrio nedwellii TaxID=2973072 RepID=UPI002493BAAE|nr:DUF2971 domain-containing protein [Pseudodesulfovibrio nedwellii]
MTASTCETILKNGTLQYSCPLVFNDPFDGQATINPNYSADDLQRVLFAFIQNLLKTDTPPKFASSNEDSERLYILWLNRQTILAEGLLDNMASCFSKIKDNDVWRELNDKLKESIKNTKVLCLAEKKDNLLMWSHYADNHKGVVFNFIIDEKYDSAWSAAQKVRYCSGYPTVSAEEMASSLVGLSSQPIEEIVLDRFITSKSMDWSYEKEWRVVVHMSDDDSYVYYGFQPAELKEIYFGCRVSEESKNRILQLVKSRYNHVDLFQCVKNDTCYKLDFESL